MKPIWSHPDKLLISHIDGVLKNVKMLSNSKLAELLALFHDLGKTNPNFQKKLKPQKLNNSYSNHAYLSAYLFFSTILSCPANKAAIVRYLEGWHFDQNLALAIVVALAKHHGDLPDFTPENLGITDDNYVLSKREIDALFNFLRTSPDLPIKEVLKNYLDLDVKPINESKDNSKCQDTFKDNLMFFGSKLSSPLDFFLELQYAFACLLLADKSDAANISETLKESNTFLESFAEIFKIRLSEYLSCLNQDSEINKLRTSIRQEAIKGLNEGLNKEKRIFELTAPTGSGKTLMMLSLASEIIKTTGPKRIIYSLPFLSITEQVEAEVLKIYKGYEEYIQRIDSKSENRRFSELQNELDADASEEKIKEASILELKEKSFSYPLIITTFVRLFETFLGNENAELLKLPNFSNTVFLIDEIQALPPRLYGFFVAYLDRFCSKFNSFAIISTATQPNYKIPSNAKDALHFFKDYGEPWSLLKTKYFNSPLFNRYELRIQKAPVSLEQVKESILKCNSSVLVILNTIDDTKDLYKLLRGAIPKDEVLLLNTHFTPRHRKLKIFIAKRRLRQGKRIILVSTQLIEAGVDIDFPVVFRDFSTVANIVQSAGRCNRNGKKSRGVVHVFLLQKNGKNRCELIYRDDPDLLRFTKQSFCKDLYEEQELLSVQKKFFDKINTQLCFARHVQHSPNITFNFIEDIKNCMFQKLGKFQIVNKQSFGDEIQLYIPKNNLDDNFERLLELRDDLLNLISNKEDNAVLIAKKKAIDLHLKQMADNIIQIRVLQNQLPPFLGSANPYGNIYKLAPDLYSFDTGVELDNTVNII